MNLPRMQALGDASARPVPPGQRPGPKNTRQGPNESVTMTPPTPKRTRPAALGIAVAACLILLPTLAPAATATVATMAAKLPLNSDRSSAVWDGSSNIYIFGAWHSGTCYCNNIWRYTPSADSMTTMPSTLPTGRIHTSAVWDPTSASAYIFGGDSAAGQLNQIVKYTPGTGAVTPMATLHTAPSQTSAVWDRSEERRGGKEG